ncbi:hypothetical protein BDQ12DRAFT_667118 [Crucibulum laeve]|uniref:Uncharacterized protein n=1 Tax=Crucibulum laeve TaxID=68775 RepID=A0A5C3LVL6_9AGAR|nr:hypothetical protein BDQ12DRAFT_667118 [Crucibulum laeve]
MEGCPFAKSGEQAQFALLLNNSTPLLKSLRFIGQVQNWQDTDNSFPVNGIEYVSWKGNGSFASSFILDVANWSLSTIQSGYTANYQNDLIDAAVASFLYAHPTLENVSFPCPMGFSGISINSNPSYTGILPNLKVFHGSARNITTLVKLMSDGVNSLEKISVEAFPYLEMKHMLYVLKTNGGLLNVTSVELCHLNVQICVMDDFSALFSHFTTALRIDIPSRLFNQRIGGVDRASLYEIFGNTQTLRVVSNEPERCTIWFKLDEEWTRIARSLSGIQNSSSR